MPHRHIHFVTGRLAEHSLRQVVDRVAAEAGFAYTIDVLGITVAALMTPEWIARRIHAPPETTEVMIPGYCRGETAPIQSAAGAPVVRGPKDLRELPEWFGRPRDPRDYGAYDIEILAEINNAPGLPLAELLADADRLRVDGADVIDLGCNPGETWSGIADAVKALRDAGYRVSVDSFNAVEVAAAAGAGAELVLSVNSTNREMAADWGCEVVAVPDVPATLEGLDETIDRLSTKGVPFRIDPVLEPIGFDFAASLGRYLAVRRRWPDAAMLMGIGNLTELTDADSGAINVLLIGFCQELSIRSVLTTQVIPWARTSVRECDLARRLAHYAVTRRAIPKHVEPRLVMLRDPRVVEPANAELDELAQALTDPNFRLFVADGTLHAVTAGLHLSDVDPFELFERLADARAARPIDASHAFYLGYELAKAVTALTLGKQYRQDESLDWGFLTRDEKTHRGEKTE